MKEVTVINLRKMSELQNLGRAAKILSTKKVIICVHGDDPTLLRRTEAEVHRYNLFKPWEFEVMHISRISILKTINKAGYTIGYFIGGDPETVNLTELQIDQCIEGGKPYQVIYRTTCQKCECLMNEVSHKTGKEEFEKLLTELTASTVEHTIVSKGVTVYDSDTCRIC